MKTKILIEAFIFSSLDVDVCVATPAVISLPNVLPRI